MSVMCHIIKDKLCTHTVHRMVTVLCFLKGICLSPLIKFRKLVRFSGLSSFKLLKRVIKLGAKRKRQKTLSCLCFVTGLGFILKKKKNLDFSSFLLIIIEWDVYSHPFSHLYDHAFSCVIEDKDYHKLKLHVHSILTDVWSLLCAVACSFQLLLIK